MPIWVLTLGAAILVTSCASTPNICQPKGARAAGKSLAMQGKPLHHSTGGVCKGSHAATFKQNFEDGYKEGKQKYCDTASVKQRAIAINETGETTTFEKASYQICDNQAAVRLAYHEGFQQGIQLFCSSQKAYEHGLSQGEKGSPEAFPTKKYRACEHSKLSQLNKFYHSGYQKGLSNYCQPPTADRLGFEDGSQGRPREDLRSKYRPCPSKQLKEIITSYDESYNKGLSQLCTQNNIDDEAKLDAEQNIQIKMPAKYSICFSRNPSLMSRYRTLFEERRNEVIRTQCSFQKGSDQGRQDAESGNHKNTSIPNYCDHSLFGTYLNGYLEGWTQAKKTLCDFSGAFDEGVKRGKGGLPASYSPPPLCPEEFRPQVQQRFMDGYQQGKGQASPKAASSNPEN